MSPILGELKYCLSPPCFIDYFYRLAPAYRRYERDFTVSARAWGAHKFKRRQGLKDEWNAKCGENPAKLSSKRALNGSQVSCREKNEVIKIYANKSGAYPVDPYAAQIIGEDCAPPFFFVRVAMSLRRNLGLVLTCNKPRARSANRSRVQASLR